MIEPLEEHCSVPTEGPRSSIRSASLLNELTIECIGASVHSRGITNYKRFA